MKKNNNSHQIYFYWEYINFGEKKTIPFNIDKYYDYSLKTRDYEYYGQILKWLVNFLKETPFTIYVTDSWKRLPSYGKNVIVILHGFGYYKVPIYADKVRAVFKNYGIKPDIFLGSGSIKLDVYSTFKYFRDICGWIPSYLSYLMKNNQNKNKRYSNIYSIPLGYGNQHNLKIDLNEKRPYDVTFYGSINTIDKKYPSFKSPKTLSRSRMINTLSMLKKKKPEYKIKYKITSSFFESLNDDGEEYSKVLSKSKICLVPRGDVYESFRFFEAVRYGCIVVTEPVPDLWFYKNSPAVIMRSWDKLDILLSSLLKDKKKLMELKNKTYQYWDKVCSEKSIAKFMAGIIKENLN